MAVVVTRDSLALYAVDVGTYRLDRSGVLVVLKRLVAECIVGRHGCFFCEYIFLDSNKRRGFSLLYSLSWTLTS